MIWRRGVEEIGRMTQMKSVCECKLRIYYFLVGVLSLMRVKEVFHFLGFFGTQIGEIELILKNCFTRLSS